MQLDFIEYISRDSSQGFTQTPYFSKAIKSLSDLLSASFIIVTKVQVDRSNYEYHLNSHVNLSQGSVITQAHSLLKFEEVPETYPDIIKNNVEVTAYPHNLKKDLFPNNPEITLPLDAKEKLFAIPFSIDEKLVGTIIYQANKSANFEQNYPAAYQCLNNVFVREAQEKQSQLKIHTYQTVLDLMPQRVFWKNRKSIYQGCNRAFSDDASLSTPLNIDGLTDNELFPLHADRYRESDTDTMMTSEHIIGLEEPQTQKSGNTIWLRKSKRPIINQLNMVVGIVGTYDDITQLKSAQQELHDAKVKLEDRVKERTLELTAANSKLESVITQLQSTQNQLIEKEKMAALGALVAGISHEINTPLGIAVTGASHLEYMSDALKEAINSGNLSKSKFMESFSQIGENSNLILRNLERARELIRNFKMIAVDQSNDKKRAIKLKEYLNDVITTMTPKTKNNNVEVLLSGDKELSILTYPGSLSQIITNLIDNSIEHAFSHSSEGKIEIDFIHTKSSISISYRDNGEGINDDILPRIFDPFFTSKRGKGGSGLGLSIVYNLVTQKLNGKISCKKHSIKGTEFLISIPI
ncbi:ATP-binding protein [Paraglaciecola sp.]|uniref:PAS domain-containing sensor histidine kinase n=1 Tax=Paraglaciecola sp. TaxID=1920173 RepID=UPI003EF5E3AB